MADFPGTPGDDDFTGTPDSDMMTGEGGNDRLRGEGGDDTIDGGEGNDVIDGGTGADAMTGGAGDDIFFVDNTSDLVNELFGGGFDLIYTTVSYTLPAEVERISVRDRTTTSSINLTGNGLDNEIWGNDGSNELDGGAGADILHGGGGALDIFYVDNVGDVVIEIAGGGLDLVRTSVDYTLSDHVERLAVGVTATTTDLRLTGNDLANALFGNFGDNILDGRAGADSMYGFDGDDIYFIDNVGDRAAENGWGGLDTVFTSIDYTLEEDIERAGVNGFATTYAIHLIGNALDNELWGNDGTNFLDGGPGVDILHGHGGNDVFRVDNAGDVVIEVAGGGSDIVYTSVSFTLPDQVEHLAVWDFRTTNAINLTGGLIDNQLDGNNGANILDGAAGADVMRGFGGNDTYFVDNEGDLIIEANGDGVDTIFTGFNYALGNNVERLGPTDFFSTFALDFTGNALANELWGNDGTNVLDGLAGADILHGRGGADIFVFTDSFTGTGTTNGIDFIVDFQVGSDKIALDHIEFRSSSNSLAVGSLPAGAFRSGTSAQDADDRIIHNPATGALLFDADGSGAGAAVQFATVSSGLVLSATDFVVI